MAKASVTAVVRDRRLLVVSVTGGKNQFLKDLAQADAEKQRKKEDAEGLNSIAIMITDVKDEVNEDEGDGPNHRGTYSKAYVLQHPEIKWVHRGQGRYLPAPKGRPLNLVRSQS